MLVAVQLPPPAPRTGARFLRFIPRNEMDIAVVNAAAWVQLDESRNRVQSARIALGAVAPTPLYLEEASQAIAGMEVGEELYARAAQTASEAARPINDMRGSIGQRRHLSGVMVRRALEGAITRARNS
jgi:carbon-monoxide dehydrogenase medium subunit